MANVSNKTNDKLVKGTAVNDTIKNSGENVTIQARGGNDMIDNTGANVSIDGSKGSDNITNSGSQVTITGGAGDDNVSNSGDSVTVNTGDGSDYISNSGNKVTISSGKGNDTISNTGDDVTINAGNNYASIQNSGSNVIINAASTSDGNIYNSGGDSVTITGGAGDEVIRNWNSDNVLIDLGAGNDFINNNSQNTTIIGGKGNDTISNVNENGFLYQYNDGDGNDYINGFNANSTLQIGGGSGTYSTITRSNDVILVVGGSSVTLSGAVGLDLNIAGVEVPYTEPDIDDSDADADSDTDTDADADADSDSDYDYTYKELTKGDDNYTNYTGGSTLDALGGEDTIQNYAARTSINGGADDDTISNSGSFSTMNGGAGDDLINNSGSNVTLDGNAGDDFIDNNASDVSISGGDGNDSIKNSGSSVTLDGGDGNDTIENIRNVDDGYWDLGNKLEATINGGKGDDLVKLKVYDDGDNNYPFEDALFQYKAGDGNDTIHGFNSTSTLQVITGTVDDIYYNNGTDIILKIGENTITLKNPASNRINVMDAEGIISEYVVSKVEGTEDADNISNGYSNVTINGYGGNDSIRNNGSSVTLVSGAGDDTITNRAGENVLINGGAGNDEIYNHYYYDDEDADADADYGSENVLFQYKAGEGNDTIHGFNPTSTLQVMTGTVDDIYYNNGTDIILKIGENTITLKNPASNRINVMDAEGIVSEYVVSKVEGTEEADNISSYRSNVSINGYGGNDSISNGYYDYYYDSQAGGSMVTINGGAGDDYINNYRDDMDEDAYYGSANVLFLYNAGDGNDTIRGFNSTSTLSVSGSEIAVTQRVDNDMVVKVGDGSITLVDAAYLDDLNIIGAEIIEGDADSDADSDTDSDSDYDDTDSDSDINDDTADDDTPDDDTPDDDTPDDDTPDDDTPDDDDTADDDASDCEDDTFFDDTPDDNLVWKVNGTSAIYGPEDSDEVLIELRGIAEDSELVTEDKIVKLSAENIAEKIIEVLSNNGGYGFELAGGSYPEGASFIGSAEKDSIINNGDNLSIDGGAGSDKILNNAFNVEIIGGAGNDNVTFSGGEQSGNIFSYSAGDGKDILYNFTENDSIKIADDSAVEAEIDGNDILFNIGNGSIKIKDGAQSEREITFIDAEGNKIDSLSSNQYTPDGVTSQDEDGDKTILIASTFKDTYLHRRRSCYG